MRRVCDHPDCCALNSYIDGQGDAFELAAWELRHRAKGTSSKTWLSLMSQADVLMHRAEATRNGERICWVQAEERAKSRGTA